MRMVLRKSLAMAKIESIEIVEAGNGIEALRLLAEKKFQLMFCDLNMPDMNGDELLEKLDDVSEFEVPSVVIVSSEATPERIERLSCKHLLGVLRKPFTPEAIAKLVSQIGVHS